MRKLVTVYAQTCDRLCANLWPFMRKPLKKACIHPHFHTWKKQVDVHLFFMLIMLP